MIMTPLNRIGVPEMQRRSKRIAHQHLCDTFRQPLSEHPEARARPPSPCPDAAPGGPWLCPGQAAHLVRVTWPGAHASHGQEQSKHAW